MIVKKILVILIVVLLIALILTGCKNENDVKESNITVAAAASLKNCMEEKLVPMFREKYPDIKIETTYDSSGKLQTQIEQGAPIDVFMSAAMKQMNVLSEKGIIAENSVVELIENKIVLIVPKSSGEQIKTFEDILIADKIAIGDPESVPAGQYAKEVLVSLDIWEEASLKASLGTNVTEVLSWVAEGSADTGIVYSTDAASNQNVRVVAEAQEGSVSRIIYPVGIIKASKNQEASSKFIEFLESDEAKNIFKSYGFSR